MTNGAAAKGCEEILCHPISHQGSLNHIQTAILTILVAHKGGM